MKYFIFVFSASEDNIILNHVIIMANFFTYQCKLNDKEPTLQVFITRVKFIYDIKRQPATRQNVLTKHPDLNLHSRLLCTCNVDP